MNTVRLLITLGVMVAAAASSAQWTVPYPIELVGSDTSARQVTGLALPLDSSSGVSVHAARTLAPLQGMATGTNALSVDLSPAPTGYVRGLKVLLMPSATNTSAVTLDVNGLGALAVHKNVSMPLDSGDLRPGAPVMLIHDGAAFQVISQLPRPCPPGSYAFTTDACIEVQPRTANTWFLANLTCADRNGRLCSMAEWTAACLSRASFLATVADFEWVDSAANNLSDAKMIGYDSVGQTTSCYKGAWAAPSDNRVYRCCYDR